MFMPIKIKIRKTKIVRVCMYVCMYDCMYACIATCIAYMT